MVEKRPNTSTKDQVKESLNAELMSYTDERLSVISYTKVAHLVIDRLKKVDNRWKPMTSEYLNQSCPVYKYIYETCVRTMNIRRSKLNLLPSSRTPTPRRDTMKELIEQNYTTSRSSSSAKSEKICTEDNPKTPRKTSFSFDSPA